MSGSTWKSNWKPKLAGRELPRLFSALSYRDLTFVFSVVGLFTVGMGVGAGATYGALHEGQN